MGVKKKIKLGSQNKEQTEMATKRKLDSAGIEQQNKNEFGLSEVKRKRRER